VKFVAPVVLQQHYLQGKPVLDKMQHALVHPLHCICLHQIQRNSN